MEPGPDGQGDDCEWCHGGGFEPDVLSLKASMSPSSENSTHNQHDVSIATPGVTPAASPGGAPEVPNPLRPMTTAERATFMPLTDAQIAAAIEKGERDRQRFHDARSGWEWRDRPAASPGGAAPLGANVSAKPRHAFVPGVAKYEGDVRPQLCHVPTGRPNYICGYARSDEIHQPIAAPPPAPPRCAEPGEGNGEH